MMKSIQFGRWPGGRTHAVTFSYDDGRVEDRQMVEVFNRHGMKATFNLNSDLLNSQNRVSPAEIKALYAGHEVACHFATHRFPTRCPREVLLREVGEDRRRLEALMGGLVTGMAYPFGHYNAEVMDILRACGIRYARTAKSTGRFAWAPDDWLEWHPTGHDHSVTPDMIQQFFTVPKWEAGGRLYYIYGHSYEFNSPERWAFLDATCQAFKDQGGDRLWTATNLEIMTYIQAVRGLIFSIECDRAENPSAIPVWIDVDGQPVEIGPGQTVAF